MQLLEWLTMDAEKISFHFLTSVGFLRKQSVPISSGWITVLQCIYILKQAFNVELKNILPPVQEKCPPFREEGKSGYRLFTIDPF